MNPNSLTQRIRLRLTRRIDRSRIAANVERLSNGDAEYSEYLKAQATKTRNKKFIDTRALRTNAFLKQVRSDCRELGDRSVVLAVGPRNHFELDAFSDARFSNVVGLDLYVSDPRIILGDMHDIPFGARRFDLVFASHVFEHAFDFSKVANEIVRVLKPGGFLFAAIPVAYEPGLIDRIDFNNVETLVSYFPQMDLVTSTTAPDEVTVTLRRQIERA